MIPLTVLSTIVRVYRPIKVFTLPIDILLQRKAIIYFGWIVFIIKPFVWCHEINWVHVTRFLANNALVILSFIRYARFDSLLARVIIVFRICPSMRTLIDQFRFYFHAAAFGDQ